MARSTYQERVMNKFFSKTAVAKAIVTIQLVGSAPVIHAQVLGGGAGGGLGGNLGGTLGGGMGSIGGMGQGGMNGTLGGPFCHGDALRRTGSGALDRTREAGGRVRDRAAGTRDTVQGAASSATSSASTQVSGAANGAPTRGTNGIAGRRNKAGSA